MPAVDPKSGYTIVAKAEFAMPHIKQIRANSNGAAERASGSRPRPRTSPNDTNVESSSSEDSKAIPPKVSTHGFSGLSGPCRQRLAEIQYFEFERADRPCQAICPSPCKKLQKFLEIGPKSPFGDGFSLASGPHRVCENRIRLSGGGQFGFARQQRRGVGAVESGTTTRGQ